MAILMNLVASVLLTYLLSQLFSVMIYDLVPHALYFLAACAISSLLYSLCRHLTRSSVGYAMGLLFLLPIFAISLGYAEAVYYSRMEAIHHDFSESIMIDSVFLLILESVSFCFYSLGYLAFRKHSSK